MPSREQILKAVRRNLPDPTPLPSLEQDWIDYPDRIEQFGEVLASVGGQMIPVADRSALNNELSHHPAFDHGERIASGIPGIPGTTVDLATNEDPKVLENIDFAILPAEFAVAENAAVWVTDGQVRHRSIYFLCEHLAFVVPSDRVVPNMHAAYERLRFAGPQFGCFVSGPSKTADIEQSLVIGAHGARSCTVFLIDDPSGVLPKA